MDFYKKTALIGLMLIAVLLGACASQGAVSTEIPTSTDLPETAEKTIEPGSPAEAAVNKLALQLDIDPESIKIISVTSAEWPNSCLGVPAKDERCLDVMTSGYMGILEANGTQYEFRSDERGEQIRFIPGAALAAQGALAQELGVSSELVHLVSFEHMMWRDSCLGVQLPNQSCLDVITPGYRVVLQANGEQYVYHTDENGDNLVQAESPKGETGAAIITWSFSDETGCQRALISFQEISFGPCEGSLKTIPFTSGMNGVDLDYFNKKYASFETETPAGKIIFQGEGDQVATQAEQRMIAEWSRLTMQVAEAGRAGAAWGLALVWHREGGIAGFCDDLAVHVYGIALASSCNLEEPSIPKRVFLNADQLEHLYAWVDTFNSFEYERTDPGTADAMTIYLQFTGDGEDAVGDEGKQAILDFAAEVYTQASGTQSTD